MGDSGLLRGDMGGLNFPTAPFFGEGRGSGSVWDMSILGSSMGPGFGLGSGRRFSDRLRPTCGSKTSPCGLGEDD